MRKTALVLALLLLLSLVTFAPGTALAASAGDFVYENTGGSGGTSYNYLNKCLTINSPSGKTYSITVKLTPTVASTDNTLAIADGSTVNLTLENINIDMFSAGSDNSPIHIGDGAHVTIYLSGTNVLKGYSGYSLSAALRVKEGSTLTITNAPGATGSLVVEANDNSAGIGGNGSSTDDGESCGAVIIKNTTVMVYSFQDGTAIGGGCSTYKNEFGIDGNGGNGGNISIKNSTVTSLSYGYSAGIGGGGSSYNNGGNGGNVTIENSSVIATSDFGTGIGGGYGGNKNGTGGTLTIKESDITVIANGTACPSPTLSYGKDGYSWFANNKIEGPGEYTHSLIEQFAMQGAYRYVSILRGYPPKPVDPTPQPSTPSAQASQGATITYTHEDWLRDNQYDEMAPASGLEPDKAAPAEELFGMTTPPAESAGNTPTPEASPMPPQTADNMTAIGFMMIIIGICACSMHSFRPKGSKRG